MKFIVILIALGLECGLNIGQWFNRFSWFDSYVEQLRKWTEKSGLWRSYFGIFIVIFPLLFIVALCYAIFYHLLFHIFAIIISLIVLLYCIGPKNIYPSLKKYFNAMSSDDSASAMSHMESFLTEMPSDPAALHREITKTIFRQFNEGLFAVLFWFVLLGPLGAVLYRVIALIYEHGSKAGNPSAALAESAKLCQTVLDWIPIRLLGLGYALMGNFMKSFDYWMRHVLTSPMTNDEFAMQTGLLAIDSHVEDSDVSDLTENKSALDLVYRTLIVYLVVLALLVIGSLL